MFVLLSEDTCCELDGKHVGMPAPRANKFRNQRGLFGGGEWGLLSQKALTKRSFLGAWKVGYQLHCRLSMGPACLHLVTFTVLSLTPM